MPLINLFDPPGKFALPLSKGDDLSVEFHYEDPDSPGDFIDWPAGVEVWLHIDSLEPIAAIAEISGYRAVIYVDRGLTDEVKAGTLWRLVVISDDDINTVACNGVTTRSDGGR